jgi:hypothetical protein
MEGIAMSVIGAAQRLIERVVMLAFGAIAGLVAGVAVSNGKGDAPVAGALIGAGIVVLIWIARGARHGVAKATAPADLGTIVAIHSQPPPGAPWYHHTYVLVDIQGKRHKLKLSAAQAQEFSAKYSVGDVGRITRSGKQLIDFAPATPAAPVRDKTGIHAFISYAHGMDQEGQMAEYVAEVLETGGLEAWVDRDEVRPGQPLRAELVKKIQACDYFVPLLSRAYMASEWCLREFEAAAEAGIPMRPIKITEERLVPPPYLKKLYEEKAGEPVYLDITARHAPQKLREMAQEMATAPLAAPRRRA